MTRAAIVVLLLASGAAQAEDALLVIATDAHRCDVQKLLEVAESRMPGVPQPQSSITLVPGFWNDGLGPCDWDPEGSKCLTQRATAAKAREETEAAQRHLLAECRAALEEFRKEMPK